MTLLRQYRRSRGSMLVCVADGGRLAPPGRYDRDRDRKRHSYWLFASGTLVRSLIAISTALSRSLARVGWGHCVVNRCPDGGESLPPVGSGLFCLAFIGTQRKWAADPSAHADGLTAGTGEQPCAPYLGSQPQFSGLRLLLC